jgi:hypothetical protein
VLEGLQARGIRLAVLFGAYGRTRDLAIGRSKIILNLHQFDTAQLEQVRLSYLLNNRCFVVSEKAEGNPYGEGVVFRDYDGLIETCEHYLRPDMEAERARIAEAGYASLKAISTLTCLRAALERFKILH